ncbi:MAG: hypothetical protein GWP62_12190 [Gammaproteobacteria bacterium]|jgi:hypothetical protein|nr:hypothetical protein [Gammaproteobacteria bacterium]
MFAKSSFGTLGIGSLLDDIHQAQVFRIDNSRQNLDCFVVVTEDRV